MVNDFFGNFAAPLQVRKSVYGTRSVVAQHSRLVVSGNLYNLPLSTATLTLYFSESGPQCPEDPKTDVANIQISC